MKNFENYDVRAWAVECLTQHVRTPTFHGKRRIGPFRATVFAAAAAALSTTVLPAPATAAQIELTYLQSRVRGATAQSQYDAILGSPAEFWSQLIAQVERWPRINAPNGQDPPEFF